MLRFVSRRIDSPKARLVVLIRMWSVDPSIVRPVLYAVVDDLLGSVPALLPLTVDGGGSTVDPCLDVVGESDGNCAFLVMSVGDHDVGRDALRLLALVGADDLESLVAGYLKREG